MMCCHPYHHEVKYCPWHRCPNAEIESGVCLYDEEYKRAEDIEGD